MYLRFLNTLSFKKRGQPSACMMILFMQKGKEGLCTNICPCIEYLKGYTKKLAKKECC